MNETGLKAIKQDKHSYPDGTIIVKENYKPNKTLAAITVMAKVKGYNPEKGNWFWAKYSPDGIVLKSGKVKGCIKCHSDVTHTDWVFTEIKMDK